MDPYKGRLVRLVLEVDSMHHESFPAPVEASWSVGSSCVFKITATFSVHPLNMLGGTFTHYALPKDGLMGTVGAELTCGEWRFTWVN